MEFDTARYAEITTLGVGRHHTCTDGMCLLEAFAYCTGQPHTDYPDGVCPLLTEIGHGINDETAPDVRQRLKGALPHMGGTLHDGRRVTRAYLGVDWVVRTWLPAWLDHVPGWLDYHAAKLRELPPITTPATADTAYYAVATAYDDAHAAGRAAADGSNLARGATFAAADAVLSTPGDVMGGATATAPLPRGLARLTDAAAFAAVQAARAAAVPRTEHAADLAGVTAAVGDLFADTVSALQDSAVDTYLAMVNVGRRVA